MHLIGLLDMAHICAGNPDETFEELEKAGLGRS